MEMLSTSTAVIQLGVARWGTSSENPVYLTIAEDDLLIFFIYSPPNKAHLCLGMCCYQIPRVWITGVRGYCFLSFNQVIPWTSQNLCDYNFSSVS